MTESGLWQYIKRGMLGKWHATRIESSAGNGVPDVSYGIKSDQNCWGVNGFIELKYIKEYPKRKTTKIKVPLRNEQKLWIKNRSQFTNHVWVCMRIENDFYLMRGASAITNIDEGGWTKDEFVDLTRNIYCWQDRINFDHFAEILKIGA